MIAKARDAIEERNKTATLAVWPQNWHAVMAFCDMGTQWQMVATMRGLMHLGLRYEALPLTLAALRPRIPERCRRPLHELMPQLRALEQAALPVLLKR